MNDAVRKTLLIVEDEALVALDIEATLRTAGYAVAGIATTVAQGLAMLEATDIDGAILDANLFGDSVAPVAEWLRAHGVPFVVVSGYSRGQLEPSMRDAPLLSKPISYDDLLTAVGRLVAAEHYS